jgi:hypothetical protein
MFGCSAAWAIWVAESRRGSLRVGSHSLLFRETGQIPQVICPFSISIFKLPIPQTTTFEQNHLSITLPVRRTNADNAAASKGGVEMANRSGGNSPKTFRGILGIVAGKNAQRLMERAQTANRLAKSLRGRSRQRAYAVKTEALAGLVRRFPEEIIVRSDIRTPQYVLIMNIKECFGLHGPAHRFARTLDRH